MDKDVTELLIYMVEEAGKQLAGLGILSGEAATMFDKCKSQLEQEQHPSPPAIPEDVRETLDRVLVCPRIWEPVRPRAIAEFEAARAWLAQCPTATDKAVCPKCGHECPIYLVPGAEDDVTCPGCRHRYGIRTLPLVVISPPRAPKEEP